MMNCFYYRILLPDGRVRTRVARLAMSHEFSAQTYLESRWDAVVLRILRLPPWFNGIYRSWMLITRGPIKRASLGEFLRNLSVMLGSGVPIISAMEELSSEDGDPQTAAIAREILESLHAGMSLSDALERHADVVPESVRHLARIGESTGTLDRTLGDAADHLARVVQITEDTRRAAIYPIFVFASIFAAALFWLYYVIPNVGELFLQMQVPLPALTRAVIDFADIARAHYGWIIAGLAILVLAVFLALRLSPRVRHGLHYLGYRLPVSRTLVRSSRLAFITEYLSLLIGAGIDMSNSLRVIEDSVGNEVYRRKIARVRVGVQRGNSLSEEMRRAQVFPGFVLRMVRIGEETGSLDRQLAHLAAEYRRRFAHVVATIGQIIQPVTLLVAGALFILMIAALFLPVYHLIGQVGVR